MDENMLQALIQKQNQNLSTLNQTNSFFRRIFFILEHHPWEATLEQIKNKN